MPHSQNPKPDRGAVVSLVGGGRLRQCLRDAPAWLPLFLAAALGVVTGAALVTAGCWAPPGGILLSQPTWNQAGDAVGSWVERQEPLTVRGFDEPLVTYLVWARRPVIGLAPYRRLEGQSPLA
ncbi:MAG: hypothetical protein RJQ04_00580 [Longimicrobiales bacterium]